MEELFKISKNPGRAKALRDMVIERLNDIKREKKPYRIIEQYYEIIKELITSLMYFDGFKTLSHKILIEYLNKYYPGFDQSEILLIDELRRLRNDILYYGKKIEKEFLINKEEDIKQIVEKLMKEVNKK